MLLFDALQPKKKRIYLDYAAATPVHKDVYKEMLPYFEREFGNPSAIHREGRVPRAAIEDARLQLARVLKVRAEDITFTSGGTESNNLALFGTVEARHQNGTAYTDMEIIATRIEHPSIIEALHKLEARGVRIVYAPVDSDGCIDTDALAALLSDKTVLVTCAYVNSEIGVVQDVKRISRLVKKYNTEHGTQVRVHIDASQAPLWLPCQVDMLGIDFLTLDAGKCYGPKGVGVLVHRNTLLIPQQVGGTQEAGLRAGTESAALILGCTAALIRAQEAHEVRAKRAAKLQAALIDSLEREVTEAVLNGSRTKRVANNINISIPGYDSEYAAVVFDAAGIAVSTKSACSSSDGEGSYVVREIGGEARAQSTLRFTLGETTKMNEIKAAVQVLKEHLVAMRRFKVGGDA